MADFNLLWRGKEIRARIRNAEGWLLNRMAEATAERLKQNIRDGGHIDTGFLLNSVYFISPKKDTYREVWETSHYWGQKSRRRLNRTKAPRSSIPDGQAAVGSASSYFIFLEARYKLLRRALDATRGEFERLGAGVQDVVGRDG